MSLQQLRLFKAVAEYKSFSRAANELYISQPAVSIHIRNLEKEYGVKLFEQLGKRIYVTEEGTILLSYVNKIFSLLDEVKVHFQEIQEPFKGNIVIGGSNVPGTYLLPKIMGKFKENFPEINLILKIASTRNIEDLLMNNKIDFGIIGHKPTNEDIKFEPLLEDCLAIIASPNHSLSNKAIDLETLIKEPFVLRETGSSTREFIEKIMSDKNLKLNIIMELGNTEAIKQVVNANLGISIISIYAVQNELQQGYLSEIFCHALELKRNFYLVYHKDKNFKKIVSIFIQFIKGALTKF